MAVVSTGKSWAVSLHVGGGRRRWIGGFQTESEARSYEATRRTNRGPCWRPVSVSEFADGLMVGLSAKEVASRRARLRPAMAVIGRMNLDRVTPSDIDQALSRVPTDAARARVWSDLRRVFATAVRRGIVATNPVEAVDRPKYRQPHTTVWTEDEARRFVTATRSHPHGLIFRFALATGMRQGEILGLQWRHVDLDRGVVRVEQDLEFITGGWRLGEPKTERARRSVVLPPEIVEELRAIRPADSNGFVFGPSYRPQTLSRWMRDLCRAAGVPQARFHDLRHAHVSILLARGAPLLLVADRVGHSRPSFTLERYAWRLGSGQEVLASISLP